MRLLLLIMVMQLKAAQRETIARKVEKLRETRKYWSAEEHMEHAVKELVELQTKTMLAANEHSKTVAREKNLEKAFEYYKKSADQGYAKAQFNLAICYENSNGVDKDLKKAMKLYELSAKQGNADAKKQIAVAKRKLDERNNGRPAKRRKTST